MKLKLTVLGCGASGGVPAIGNFWGQCDPDEPRNERLRASIAVQSDDSCMIIDTGPDFRQQLNRAGISDIDGVIYTHAHGDHIAGMDDLRSFQRRYKQPTPVYGHSETMEVIESRFSYMFIDKPFYPCAVTSHYFAHDAYGQLQTVAGIPFIPFEQDHGTCTSLGFRFGSIGYSTDMVRLEPQALEVLKGIDTWIVDGAGHYHEQNAVHAAIPQVLEMNKTVQAREIYLTHLSLMMDYRTLSCELPDGVFPCYDGLVFETDA